MGQFWKLLSIQKETGRVEPLVIRLTRGVGDKSFSSVKSLSLVVVVVAAAVAALNDLKVQLCIC